MRRLFAIFLLIAWPLTFFAQESTSEEDKGRITRYLEDALSGLGRDVQIDGFKGALSSRVSMDRMTIADADGIWLTLTDAVLDWNRLAILQGRINIEQISAAKIDVARAPVPDDEVSPEASGSFSLPELPVSIDIGSLSVKEVTLGETLLGEVITLSVDGSVTLEGGEGQAKLNIVRSKGPRGSFELDGSYANLTRQLALDLTLDEAKDGITSTLLNLPGKPALELTVKGDAPIDEFVAEIGLRSDGQDRLTGQVSTQTVSAEGSPVQDENQELPRIISVDVSGDLAPLFAPQYQPFFGRDVGLQSLVQLFPDGRVTLEKLKLKAAALLLEGQLSVTADGLPEQFEFRGVMENADQSPVILPVTGPETKLRRAELTALFDASEGDVWIFEVDMTGFERPDVTLDKLELAANGVIQSGDTRAVTAKIDSLVRGIAFKDEALTQALGDNLEITGDLGWSEGQLLDLNDFRLTGDGMQLSGVGKLSGLDSAATFTGEFQAEVENLERLSDISGRPLSGAVNAKLSGEAALLTGAFDLDLNATGTDLTIGIDKVDSALVGDSTFSASGKRDENGLTLHAAEVKTLAGRATADGFINSGQTNFEFSAALDDISRFVSGIAGPVNLSGEATEHDTGWLIDLEGSGPFQSDAKGRLTVPNDGEPSVKLSGNIGNVGALLPDLPGSASFDASIRQKGSDWTVDTTGQGPGGSTFAVAGTVRSDVTRANLEIDGTLPLALANRRLHPNAAQGMAEFDLKLDGPLKVSSLSGRLNTSGARLSLPDLQNALTDTDVAINLSGNLAEVQASATLATGGRFVIAGQVGTGAPYATNLGIQILDAVIRDAKLFETTARGNLLLSGTVPDSLNIAGRINLDNTEIRVPSSSLGVGSIPEISHVNEPGDVRQTRRFAGLLDKPSEDEAKSGGLAIGLDILIVSDSRIFVRGRGVDAELGGRFRVTGTTADIIPIGGFDLIRGRLDILGKRLTLDEGRARLQGDFVPGLRLVASTVSDDDTVVRIVIEGRADEPEVTFESDPSLPEDEVLARLLFGRDVGSLSAFQALQLASAVATLAGRGGISLAERVREATGVDDFSVNADDDGETSVGIGKYIGDKVYTDVQIGDESNTEINLNIDLSRRTKVRGSFGSDGSSGVGVFFEKDY
ncbi:translocation/assembly module TamB domain-containing protein [uncultured Roseovarius sp.]|uniref:translocation/assembly module TamB domain-containing protein n=1 Tax=uncultured Roseovarius sp. TaxID=293344 RepID=UPI00261906B4|nr:translocation/assembly module TamB domain-containing protein [uncultured Roseovarius sp.]